MQQFATQNWSESNQQCSLQQYTTSLFSAMQQFATQNWSESNQQCSLRQCTSSLHRFWLNCCVLSLWCLPALLPMQTEAKPPKISANMPEFAWLFKLTKADMYCGFYGSRSECSTHGINTGSEDLCLEKVQTRKTENPLDSWPPDHTSAAGCSLPVKLNGQNDQTFNYYLGMHVVAVVDGKSKYYCNVFQSPHPSLLK